MINKSPFKNTIIIRAIHACYDPHSFDSEIQYIKAIVIYRGYNYSIIETAEYKLQHPRSSVSNQSSSVINLSCNTIQYHTI